MNTAITDAQGTYTTVSAISDRVKWVQTVVVALCLALGCVMAFSVLTLLTPVQQMIGASRRSPGASSIRPTCLRPVSRKWPS